ncbi:MAG: hypothetical protein NT075_27350 [Chloroflexi bacterium]|nr:hypothetical protein [Chloroflexota bacterium]
MKIFGVQSNHLWKLSLALILLIGLGIFVSWLAENRGTQTKDELISQYIAAIRQENPNQILQLIPSSHVTAQVELTNIIYNSGGKALLKVQTADLPSESGTHKIIELTGTYTKNGKLVNFTDRLYLQETNERWYLLLGRARNDVPTDAPSSKPD